MNPLDKKFLQIKKIDACRELYLKCQGRDHALIENGMRAAGWSRFSRRNLYARTTTHGTTPGWIERFAWHDMLGTSRSQARAKVNRQKARRLRKQRHHPAGTVGALACKAAKALLDGNMPTRNIDVANSATHHAGGTCAHGDGACSPGSAAPGPAVSDDFEAFQDWLKRVSPTMTWDWKHQVYIYDRLQRVTSGECRRLMIFMPPRHGKSELVTVRYTAWRMRREPSLNVILASYNQRLANRFSRKIRRVLCDDAALATDTREVGKVRLAVPVDERSIPDVGTAPSGDRETTRIRDDEMDCRLRSPSPPPQPVTQLSTPTLPVAPSPSRMFPFTSSKPVNSIAEWGTAAGGGLRAVGVGSGVTGFGADLIVIDDPVKNRAQAESETFRDNVWEWYNDDIYTRLEPGGSLVLIQTRWHEDDLAGRLLRQMENGGDEWTVVDLPALAEAPGNPAGDHPAQNHSAGTHPAGTAGALACIAAKAAINRGEQISAAPDVKPAAHYAANPAVRHTGGTGAHGDGAWGPDTGGPGLADSSPRLPSDWRDPGQALCPERYDETKLAEIRTQLGTYSFSALYQQQPTPADGAKFKREWLRNIIDEAPQNLMWFRGYDLAISTRTSADYTASFRVAKDKTGNFYIADGFRKRIEYPEQRRYILERIKKEKNTVHGIEESLHGRAIVQDLRRIDKLSNRIFRSVKVVGDKVTRSLAWANVAEEGKLALVRGPWVDEFIDELIRFPNGKHDDQIDAVSIAIGMIADTGKKIHFLD